MAHPFLSLNTEQLTDLRARLKTRIDRNRSRRREYKSLIPLYQFATACLMDSQRRDQMQNDMENAPYIMDCLNRKDLR